MCTQDHVYECSSTGPNECEDNVETRSQCQPNIMYVKNDTICICDTNGQWPHDKCNKILQSLGPVGQLIAINCKPYSYVKYDCNVCRCGPDGKLNKDRCTKNKCEHTKSLKNYAKSRRASQQNVYGNCEVKNWYSLAPCQFCFCVNENRLVCNTGNSYSHKLELGAYNLSVCGKELIREAIELIPEHQKTLRYGIENKTNVQEIPAKEITLHENSVAINVNHEEGNLKFETNNNQDENDEYYTDSEENKPPANVIGREAPSIPPPVTEKSVLREEAKESEQELETDNEMGVEIEAEINRKPVEDVDTKQSEVPSPNQQSALIDKLPQNFNLGEALKLNLPMVLDKVFQMALRKSMISVDSNTKCTPGAATILKCNVCFCINENKLLCTNNVCE